MTRAVPPVASYAIPHPDQQLTHVVATASKLIATGDGVLFGLNINTPKQGGVCSIYDGIDPTGTLLGVVDITTNGVVEFSGGGWRFHVGLFVNPTGGGDLTFNWMTEDVINPED
jgi:hypothetical protein